MSKSPVQAALPEAVDARRTCQEAGTGGAGLVRDPRVPGEAGGWGALWPTHRGEGAGAHSFSPVEVAARFFSLANCNGTLRVVSLVRAWMGP